MLQHQPHRTLPRRLTVLAGPRGLFGFPVISLLLDSREWIKPGVVHPRSRDSSCSREALPNNRRRPAIHRAANPGVLHSWRRGAGYGAAAPGQSPGYVDQAGRASANAARTCHVSPGGRRRRRARLRSIDSCAAASGLGCAPASTSRRRIGTYSIHGSLSPGSGLGAVHLSIGVPHWFSHDSAAALLGMSLLDRRHESVHVTRPRLRGRRARAGVVHHGAKVHPSEVTELGWPPCARHGSDGAGPRPGARARGRTRRLRPRPAGRAVSRGPR